MKIFTLLVERTETYTAEVAVAAETAEQAIADLHARGLVANKQRELDQEGWDSVVDDDGEYAECYSVVIKCEGQLTGQPAADTDYWMDDPEYPSADWKYEVANDDTRLGYWEWVASRREQDAESPE